MNSRWVRLNNLRDVMKSRGYSQRRLAQEIGVSRTAVLKYCSGDSSPSPEVYQQILSVLQCTPEALAGDMSAEEDTARNHLRALVCDGVARLSGKHYYMLALWLDDSCEEVGADLRREIRAQCKEIHI